MKLLLRHILGDRKDDKNEVLLQLDEIQGQLRLHDHKLNLLAKHLAGMDLSQVTLSQTQVPPDVGQPST